MMASMSTHDREIIKLARSAQVETGVFSAAWSPDGLKIATASGSPVVLVWNASSLSVERKLDQGAKGVASTKHTVAFSADGRILASGLRCVNVWDTATWQRKLTLVAPFIDLSHPQPIGVRSLAFSSDEQALVVAYNVSSVNDPVLAYRLTDGAISWTYHQQQTIGNPMVSTPLVPLPKSGEIAFGSGEVKPAWDSDGEVLARIAILDTASGALIRSIDRIHVDAPTALAASRDGKWLATGTTTGVTRGVTNIKTHVATQYDNQDPIRIWNAQSGRLSMELMIRSRVWALVFSPDGKYLIASQSDIHTHHTLSVWSVDSGDLVQSIEPTGDLGVNAPFDLEFSPNGKQLAVAGGQTLAIYDYVGTP
jgi:WD40 repeat protein